MGTIITLEEFSKIRTFELKEKKVVLATGVFDILHIEHLHYLKKAKAEGDVLVVGVDPDESVKSLKGDRRPINPQNDRAELLSELNFVDYVIVLPNDLNTVKSRENAIILIKPDIYAVSQNSPFLSEKERIMEKFGGVLKIVHTNNPKISTSIILEKLSGS